MLSKSPLKFKRIRSQFAIYFKYMKQKRIKSIPFIVKDICVKFFKLLISKDKYFLYEKILKDGKTIEIKKPRVEDVKMESIFLKISIEEYESLGEREYDFRKHSDVGKFSIDKDNGTFVFLGIKDNKIIYRSCISNYCNGVYKSIYPSKLDNGYVCYQGFNWTHPDYRNMGLYTWAQTIMFDFMKNSKYEKVIMLEPKNQIGPIKVQDRLGSSMICESYCFRLLFFINFRWNKPKI